MLSEILFRTYRLLISRRFAISLLIAISVLLLLGILLPSASYHEPSEMTNFSHKHPIIFELGKVFNPPTLTTSWTFLILTALLMLSTILCCIERIRNREYVDPYKEQPKLFRQKMKIELRSKPPEVFEASLKALRRHWWQLGPKRARDDFLFLEARKGAFGFWGSIIFHLGFLAILLGVIVSSQTRFMGSFLVVEGQQLTLLKRNFTQVYREPPGNYDLPGNLVYLRDFKANILKERFPVYYSADVAIAEQNGSVTSKTIMINQAIKHRDYSMLLRNYGFAPHMVLKSGKKTLLDAFINLRGRVAGSKDSFSVPGTKIEVRTVFYPNFNLTSSLVPRAPVYSVIVKDKGKRVFKGYLRKGKSIRFNDMVLSFPNWRYWAYFDVIRDHGIAMIFWGFVVSFIGLVFRFVMHDRQLSIRIKSVAAGSEVLISGRSRVFPVIFQEELGRLARAIEGSEQGGILSWARLKQYFSG